MEVMSAIPQPCTVPCDFDRLIQGYRFIQTALFGDPCCTECLIRLVTGCDLKSGYPLSR